MNKLLVLFIMAILPLCLIAQDPFDNYPFEKISVPSLFILKHKIDIPANHTKESIKLYQNLDMQDTIRFIRMDFDSTSTDRVFQKGKRFKLNSLKEIYVKENKLSFDLHTINIFQQSTKVRVVIGFNKNKMKVKGIKRGEVRRILKNAFKIKPKKR